MLHSRPIWFALVLVTLVLPNTSAAQDDDLRTIEFETSEVTAPDIAVSPDGEWLIFTMLGHLFRLPVEGGEAEQLTFGPYYDTDPVFSPDGSRVVLVSDRDGSDGNVFVLELATGQITQVTREAWAARPAWSPDGQSIVYLSLVREVLGVTPLPNHSIPDTVPARVRRVAVNGGQPETIFAAPKLYRSINYLPDGRLVWTVIELKMEDNQTPRATSRIEARDSNGDISELYTVPGYLEPLEADPTGNGFYGRRFFPVLPWHTQRPEDFVFLPLPEGAERLLFTLSPARGWTPRFAVAPDNKSLFLGENRGIWQVELPGGARTPIPFRAQVKLEIQEPILPPTADWLSTESSSAPQFILHPRLSPDGQTLVFGAAGYLWQQHLQGGPARRLFSGSAIERDPAFSSDGGWLAFVHIQHGKEEIRVLSLETGEVRTIASGQSYWNLNWASDVQQLVFVEIDTHTFQSKVIALSVSDRSREELAEIDWWWGSRPHLSSDRRELYFAGRPGAGQLYRLRLTPGAKPEAITQLERQLMRPLVFSKGQRVVFKRNREIWMASLESGLVKEEHLHRLSKEGGNSFAIAPDGLAVIYSAGKRVWRQPLGGGPREEIPVRLELGRSTPPPLLLRRVRVLDFRTGGFGPESSILIERGRIRWIGSEDDRTLTPETTIIDAGGRFAIPGLFDMHVHEQDAHLQKRFLAYGVTSVRDVSGWLEWLGALKDRSENSSDPLPRYFFSGDMFRGGYPIHPSLWLLIYDEDDARHYVRLWKQWGADFLKVYYPLSWTLQRVVAEEARRQGLPVVGHGSNGVAEIVKSVTLGYTSLEHSLTPTRAGDDVLQLLAAAGTRWDPTLSTRGHPLLLRDEPERLADAKLRAFTPEWAIREARAGGSSMWTLGEHEARGRWVDLLASVKDAHERGVKLLIGTDRAWLAASLHWELEYFVQAGLSPLEVLRIATQEAAEAVGAENELGTLEPGKLADIVLLNKNPLEDIKNTQTIWRVIKGGWVFDPEALRPGRN